MKKLVLVFSVLLSSFVYSQNKIDTIYVVCVEKSNSNGQQNFIVGTSDGNEYLTNYKHSVGEVFSYYDSLSNTSIPKWEYENSLFEKLYFSEYLFDSNCKPVSVVSRNLSNDKKFKYEIVTDSNITYFTNYPPNVGDVVFHITEKGNLVNVVKPFKVR